MLFLSCFFFKKKNKMRHLTASGESGPSRFDCFYVALWTNSCLDRLRSGDRQLLRAPGVSFPVVEYSVYSKSGLARTAWFIYLFFNK